MKERIKIIWFIRKWNLWKFIKNTINQEKIGTFDDINIYKMDICLKKKILLIKIEIFIIQEKELIDYYWK